ncbi:hypothetical protein EAH76_03120 [Sphingomonas glacialis]|uniref:Uncharacterized protein n=2 Tax=Sphingomonas glacialis TaxID=658225 RepID=A0A502G3V7_9SPHN|nr:hypothetical protein EAH76_03120 [Sphingomonas glacialis]
MPELGMGPPGFRSGIGTDLKEISLEPMWISISMPFCLAKGSEIDRSASGDTAMHMINLQSYGHTALRPSAVRLRTNIPNTARANALTTLNCALEAAQRWTKIDPSALDEIQDALDLAQDALRQLHALG